MRLVPDMTASNALAMLKAHLARHGFGDIEVNMTGGYDPTKTPADSKLVRAMTATYKKSGVEPLLWPRLAGSWSARGMTTRPTAHGMTALCHPTSEASWELLFDARLTPQNLSIEGQYRERHHDSTGSANQSAARSSQLELPLSISRTLNGRCRRLRSFSRAIAERTSGKVS